MNHSDMMFSQIQRKHFNTIADQYVERLNEAAYLYYFGETKRIILNTLISYFGKEDLLCKRGLDVGCGVGDITGSLARSSGSMTGTDIAEGMCRLASHKQVEFMSRFLPASSNSLPFKDSSFDFIISAHVFHHLIDPEVLKSTIREFRRIVKSGGLMVIVDVNPVNPISKLTQYLMVKRGVDTGKEKLIFPWIIFKEFRASSIKHFYYRGYCFVPHLLPCLSSLNDFFGKTPLHVFGKDYIIAGIPDKEAADESTP
ncbi:MAG: methyltransferase domain-containing protein [Gemmatimonadota bacterium]|nr:methyltransferase domain-containing protein [Gemmatimonadota bacterium]